MLLSFLRFCYLVCCQHSTRFSSVLNHHFWKLFCHDVLCSLCVSKNLWSWFLFVYICSRSRWDLIFVVCFLCVSNIYVCIHWMDFVMVVDIWGSWNRSWICWNCVHLLWQQLAVLIFDSQFRRWTTALSF